MKKILLTGASGYIGQQLLPLLLAQGHYVVCCVRDLRHFPVGMAEQDRVSVIHVDFLDPTTFSVVPEDISGAYYLMHSLDAGHRGFAELETKVAENFRACMEQTRVDHVVYLSGIVNSDHLSPHLASRRNVEDILAQGAYHLSTLRAGIIIGAGSASFRIIRDLVGKLPVMVAPRWLNTRSQPIALKDVLQLLVRTLFAEAAYDSSFDIGGPGILTYREMLQICAREMGLKRFILTVPVMTPRLSSYWLYFVTSVSYPLAVNLVDSMKVDVVCRNNDLARLLGVVPESYVMAVRDALAEKKEKI